MRNLSYIVFIWVLLFAVSCEKIEPELYSIIDNKNIILENKALDAVKEIVKGRWKVHSTYYPLSQETHRYKNTYWTFEEDKIVIETEDGTTIKELFWTRKYPDHNISSEMLNVINTDGDVNPDYILGSDIIIRKVEKGFLILDQSYWDGGIHKLSKFK